MQEIQKEGAQPQESHEAVRAQVQVDEDPRTVLDCSEKVLEQRNFFVICVRVAQPLPSKPTMDFLEVLLGRTVFFCLESLALLQREASYWLPVHLLPFTKVSDRLRFRTERDRGRSESRRQDIKALALIVATRCPVLINWLRTKKKIRHCVLGQLCRKSSSRGISRDNSRRPPYPCKKQKNMLRSYTDHLIAGGSVDSASMY